MAKSPSTPATQDAETTASGGTDLAHVAGTGLTDANAAAMFAEFAGLGTENVNASDLLVPRLTILQALSPQIQKKKAEYIEGSEVGQIVDVGLGEVIGDGTSLLFLPVYYRKDYLEWAPRETGGGLVNVHSDPSILDQTRPDDRGRPILPNGNLIAETAQFFGFIMSEDGEEFRPAFIPMASTQLKKARKWLTLADKQRIPGANYKAPLFWAVYKLATADEGNTRGDWVGWTINVHSTLPQFAPAKWQEVMGQARKLLDSLRSGEVRGDMGGMDGAEGGTVIDGDTI